jgi:hypothetical protein
MAKKKKDIESHYKVVRSGDHKSHYVIGAIPQITEDDIRLHMFNEIIDSRNGSYYISTTQIILPKSAALRLWETLGKVLRSDGKVKTLETTIVPMEVATAVEREKGEKKEKSKSKKKVQKIRLK